MSSIHRFGASDAQRLDRQYAAPVMVEQRQRTLEALALRAGESALDVGCGPGYLTLEMARQVGPSGRVLGIDTSEPMLAVARERCASLPWAQFQLADACNLPDSAASFDAVAAVQIYLFVAELERAVNELGRVLRPSARAVIVDTDWDSVVWHSSAPQRMQQVMETWMQRYANAKVARLFPGALRRAGLRIEQASAIAIVELAPDEASYSGSQLPEVARYVAGKGGISVEDAQAWQQDLLALAERGDYFFGLNRYLFVARKPG